MKRNARGLTLIEVLIASVVMLFITAAIFALVWRGGLTYTSVSKMATLQRNAQVVLERIAEELRIADPDKMNPAMPSPTSKPLTSPFLQFYCSTGVQQPIDPLTGLGQVDDNGTPVLMTTWGSLVEYAYEASDVDANENGTQDEGRLVRKQDGQTVRLCDYVKLDGLVFTLDGTQGNQVKISLTLQVSEDGKKMLSTTVTTNVVIRNRKTT